MRPAIISTISSIVVPMLIAFFVTWLSGRKIIPYLRRIKAGQTEREDGPKTHLSKTGTPNMGGLMILLGFTIACLFAAVKTPHVLPVLFLTIGYGAVGFVDDYIKVVLKRSMGLRAWQKIVLQFVIGMIFAVQMRQIFRISMAMKVPFAAGHYLHFGYYAIPFLLFVVLATVNGTNLNDGVDGMSSCVTTSVALFFTITAVVVQSDIAPAGGAMIGALLGFLIYNAHPAQVFMGDTGSLALGGFVCGMAYMLQMPLFIPIAGFIYVLEVISVIIQVGYFKATHGKRFFRMAPIHHHFELGGWSEVKVVAVFTIVTVLMCAVALLGIW